MRLHQVLETRFFGSLYRVYGDLSKVQARCLAHPRGCSKYNPIEHRLFSYISINWAGKPLRTFDTVLNYIRDTTTSTGLKVKAFFNEKIYEKGLKVTDAEMNLERSSVCPQWNYTIRPAGVSG